MQMQYPSEILQLAINSLLDILIYQGLLLIYNGYCEINVNVSCGDY